MRSLLITGINGFLGSALARDLCSDFRVLGIVRPGSDRSRIQGFENSLELFENSNDSLDRLFSDYAPEWILHTAVTYGRDGAESQKVYEANLKFPKELLGRAKAISNFKGFVNTDTYFHKLPDECSVLADYRASKKEFRESLKEEVSTIPSLTIFLEHLYGPDDRAGKFVPEMIRKISQNEPEIALTEGEQKRDFVFLDDVVSAYRAVLEREALSPCTAIFAELGTGNSTSIREFLEMISSLSGSQSKLKFGALPYREGELMESAADTTFFRKLGWSAQVPLEEGLQKVLSHE